MIRSCVSVPVLSVPAGLDEAETAVCLCLSPSFFRKLVDMKVMPRPRIAGGRRIWDVDELDQAFKAPPREGSLLKTGWGIAFSAKGISNFMAEKIGMAGLPAQV